MAYNSYSNNYNTMYEFDGKYFYSGALLSFPNDENNDIKQDDTTNEFFIRVYNPLVKELVNVGLGRYSYQYYGYSESGGKIVTGNTSPFIGKERYFPEYFRRSSRWVVKNDVMQYTFEPVLINGKEHINIDDLGAAFGFSLSMQKDDINKIQLINITKI